MRKKILINLWRRLAALIVVRNGTLLATVAADILACLLDFNFKQSSLLDLIFCKHTLLNMDAYFA